MVCEFLSPAEAVTRWVTPSSVVAVGGMHMTAAPMSLVREIVRQRIRIRRLITSPSTSLQADLIIGAGLVDELLSPYVGFEHLGLAPSFRRAVEAGHLRVLECDEGSLTHAFYAGAGGLSFIPCPPGFELTDIPKVNPALYRQVQDPFTAVTLWAVAAVQPDVALVHCIEADEMGNVAFGGFPFTDRLMALASRRVIVQVERVIAGEQMATHPPGTTLPGFLVSAIVVAPGGCHPTAAPGAYGRDEDAIREYLEAARTPEGCQAYLDRTILSLDEHGYLKQVRARQQPACPRPHAPRRRGR